MPFGTRVEYKIFRQVKQEKLDEVRDVTANINWGFYAIGIIVFLVAMCFGPLLPVWMFFNSL